MNNKYHTRYFHLKYLRNALKNTKGKLLNVGCGIGFYDLQLAKQMPNLTFYGCDTSKRDLAEFKKRAYYIKDFSLKLCDAHKLSYKDKYFDAVIITDVLEHLKEPNKAIREISRVLKKGGVFHLAVPLEGELNTYDGWIKLLFNKNLKEKPIGHIQQFRQNDIEKILEKNGFEIKRVKYTYFLFYQTLSLIYFSFASAVNQGKYIKVHGHDRRKFKIKLLEMIISVIGWITCLESGLLANLKGQTLHVTSIKRG